MGFRAARDLLTRPVMSIHHTVVWLDHREAKVFHFDADNINETDVQANSTPAHLHNRAAVSGRREEDSHYYHEVAASLAASAEVLVVGPSTAKLEPIRHIHRHDQALEPRIVGVETVDHPTDGQLVAYAKKYFRAADRLR